MSAAELDAIQLTIALATITTVLLLMLGTPLASTAAEILSSSCRLSGVVCA